MDFDDAKENIQPLAAGRNACLLQASLQSDAHEMLEQRRQLEQAIRNYQGDDPLESWFSYIDWIEQSCPSGGKESGLQEVLVKCLTRFENDAQYYQDERMVKLYIKFINGLKEPLEKYEALFKAGIGTMVADFYISWAYVADLCGNSRKADEIFRHGIKCNAQPKEVLLEAHQHFRYYVGQRLMYKDDEEELDKANRELHDRRMALASLRKHGRKANVGSIRTGAAVKSVLPGIVQSAATSAHKNKPHTSASVGVYRDENVNPSVTAAAAAPLVLEEHTSAVRMLINAARNQENDKEPGPWNKAHDNKLAGKLFTSAQRGTHLNFDIHEDKTEPILPKVEIASFKYPTNFVESNRPQIAWITPVTTEEQAEPRAFPQYNKCMLYPRTNLEFQLEELRAYYWFKRRGIKNAFTTAREPYWSVGNINAPVRQYPNFAKQSLPQKADALDEYYQPAEKEGQMFCFKRLYNAELREEFQNEELMWQRRQQRLLDIKYTDDAMDETMCTNSERVRQRKSFFPVLNRKSIMPPPPTPPSPPTTTSDHHEKECANNSGIVTRLLQSAKSPEQSVISAEPQNIIEQKEDAEEGAVGGLGFEIYEDTTQFKMPPPLRTLNPTPPIEIAEIENKDPLKFTFKTPMPASAIATKSNKFNFEIYQETDTSPQNKEDGYFDGEETCCTQQFNILLKDQCKMSTPKVPQKPALRKPLQPLPLLVPEETVKEAETKENAIVQSEQNADMPATEQKVVETDEEQLQEPFLKDLSTILETSEHGSSHATAASRTNTKSSCISSPELDTLENAAVVTVTTNHKMLTMHTELETVQEQSIEQSVTANITAKAITKDETASVSTTPALARFPNQSKLLQEKDEQKDMVQGGNFSRFEQRDEDTAHLCGSMRAIRFQEDKTDTMSKNMLVPATCNKTVRFQEDKTETFTKLLNPAKNVTTSGVFQDDKTETFSKLITAPKLPELTPKKTITAANVYGTPELNFNSPSKKLVMEKNAKFTENPNSTANLLNRDSMLQLDDTPPGKKFPVTPKFKYRDSFVPEFSFIAETQTAATTTDSGKNNTTNTNQTKNKVDESFLPQLSMLEDQNQMAQQAEQNLSIIPATQQMNNEDSGRRWQQYKKADSKQNESLLPNISLIECSQPTNTDLSCKQKQQADKSQQNIHMLPSSFIKDFNIPAPKLKFMQPSEKMKIEQKNCSATTSNKPKAQFLNNNSTSLKFLNDSTTKQQQTNGSRNNNKSKISCFEGNCETAQFTVDNSMIRNSTWLPEQQHQNRQQQQKDLQPTQAYYRERSIHIKQEAADTDEMSIYYKETPKSPKETRHAWVCGTSTPDNNKYEHHVVDLNNTQQIIQSECNNAQMNPFSVALTNAFLDDIAFTEYIATLPTCQLQRHISRLQPKQQIRIQNQQFDVMKLIGEGAYGTIYIGLHIQTGKKMALKQEQPPNCWEYYICLEIQSRIKVDDMEYIVCPPELSPTKFQMNYYPTSK